MANKVNFLQWLFCKHPNMQFVRNLYGDELNHASLTTVYRSVWQCADCLMFENRRELHDDKGRL
ncbi:MAG: hypothetical protein K0S19_715 [Geminicoccaceae bacterium]|nr:hypothetical protein [Geminicoccaceae bacterium]